MIASTQTVCNGRRGGESSGKISSTVAEKSGCTVANGSCGILEVTGEGVGRLGRPHEGRPNERVRLLCRREIRILDSVKEK